jgi:indole-3-glycerol phosphate synthase
MNNILNEIYEHKKTSLDARKREMPLEKLKEHGPRIAPLRDFRSAIARKDRVNIIAEIKKASPSAGMLRADIDPAALAAEYAAAGAAALSVLTEEKYFQGDLSYLQKAREQVSVPLLRKDFIFDEYQVHESLAAGADAILLIAALLETHRMASLIELSNELGLDCLVEVHDEQELKKVLHTPADIIGINNRNLNDFSVNLATAEELATKIPAGKIIVIESGIKNVVDVRNFYGMGICTFLVGEALLRSADIKGTLRELKGAANG